jgi:hypothetical protein
MTTVQIAKYTADILNALPTDVELGETGESYIYEDYDGNVIASVYLGSSLSLDPCGRYHHILSPNGVTQRCIAFWESLERQIEKRGLSLTSGEGDPLDTYVERWLRDSDKELN